MNKHNNFFHCNSRQKPNNYVPNNSITIDNIYKLSIYTRIKLARKPRQNRKKNRCQNKFKSSKTMIKCSKMMLKPKTIWIHQKTRPQHLKMMWKRPNTVKKTVDDAKIPSTILTTYLPKLFQNIHFGYRSSRNQLLKVHSEGKRSKTMS